MTLPASPRKSTVVLGNGATVNVPFSFKVTDPSEVQLIQTSVDGVNTTLVQNSDYTITINPDQVSTPGGLAVLAVAGAVGTRTVAIGNVDYGQPVVVPNAGNYKAELHEKAFDRIVTQIQQLLEIVGRGVVTNVTDTGNVLTMPALAARLGKFLAFDPVTGDLIPAAGVSNSPTTAFTAALLAAANQTAFLAALGNIPVASVTGALAAGLLTASGLTLPTSTIAGRVTAGTGAVEALTPAQLTALLAPLLVLPRGHLGGLTMSTAGASTTMSVAAGQAVNDTGVRGYALASAMAKTTAAWAAGNAQGGKLSAAAIATNTWYYWFLLYNDTTGAVDVGFDVSPTAPTLPSGYTHARYIGAGLINGSSRWTKFTQIGDDFFLDTPVLDFAGAGSTTAVLLTLSAPRGRKVKATLNIFGTTSTGIYISDPNNADVAPTSSAAPLGALYTDGAAGQVTGVGGVTVWTDTSAQIRYRCVNTNTMRIATLGWTDLRGKNA